MNKNIISSLQENYTKHRIPQTAEYPALSSGFFAKAEDEGLIAAFQWMASVHEQQKLGNPHIPSHLRALGTLFASTLIAMGAGPIIAERQEDPDSFEQRNVFEQQLAVGVLGLIHLLYEPVPVASPA